VHDILKDMDVKTYEGNTFLQVNNAEKGILLFNTDGNLKFLMQLTTFYVNGTFSYCAQFFLPIFHNSCNKKQSLCTYSFHFTKRQK